MIVAWRKVDRLQSRQATKKGEYGRAVYTIDIDTGGTFTDGYICGDDKEISIKVETTPHDLTLCFFTCIEEGARLLGLNTPGLLDQTRVIRFSSTIATNAAVQMSGPKLGAIVTQGAEDSLYSENSSNPATAFIPPKLVVGIRESVDDDGAVVQAPDEAEVDDKVRFLLENGARMLVISLRNAHFNPTNELQVRKFINAAYPRHYLGAVPLLVSHQVSRVPSDELRTNTAIINAYFHRDLVNSLYKAEDLVRAQNYHHPLMIVTADSGVTRVAKTKAISTYQSGPASGVRGAYVLGNKLGHDRLLSIDVGGTTSDVSFVVDGQPVSAKYRPINDVQVAQRIPDIVSFGLGGGSRIRLGDDGAIKVGPESQGAVPGPACFGLGGRIPTPTDVWLQLGYLAPDQYLGGRKTLDVQKSQEVIRKSLAEPLGLSEAEAALQAKDAIEAELARHVLERGPVPDGTSLDGATLYSVGGGAGLLAAGLAQKLKMRRVYVPANAAVFCAFGASTLDVSHVYEEILSAPDGSSTDAYLEGVVSSLKQRAVRDMRGEGYSDDEVEYSIDIECLAGVEEVARASGAFANGAISKEAADLVKNPPRDGQYMILRLTATCPKPHPEIEPSIQRSQSLSEAQLGTRQLHAAAGETDAPVYQFDKIGIGTKLDGPAILENEHTSVLVPAGVTFEIDIAGNGVMELGNG